MALVPHKITALAESDAYGTDGKNIVAGAVVSLFDTTGAAVTLFDDEAGNNGSTAKQTDSSGQVVVWVTPGEYSESVNGSTQRAVTIGGRTVTSYPNTESMQNSRPTQTGQRAENRERANAQYELAASGYTAVNGDIVAANGRVWALSGGEFNFYVDVNGSDTNQGLSSGDALASLIKLTEILPYYARYIKGPIVINLAAGTYTDGLVLDGLYSEYLITVKGQGKASTIVDGTTATTLHGLNFNACNRVRVEDLTVRNFDGVGSGIIFQNGTSGVIVNCDAHDNAEANANASDASEIVVIGECNFYGASKYGIRAYRNSGGSIGDGVNPITITGALQCGIVSRDGSKVVCVNGLTIQDCNAFSTSAAVWVYKDGYVEVRDCDILNNRIGFLVEHNGIIDTQSGTRNLVGNTEDYVIKQGSYDRSNLSTNERTVERYIPNNKPSGNIPSTNYHVVIDHDGQTGMQFLTNGNIVNIDFDKVVRVAYVPTDTTVRIDFGSVSYRASTSGFYPSTPKDLGLSFAPWQNVHANQYHADGNAGASGTFTTNDGKTVTVTAGIITSIV